MTEFNPSAIPVLVLKGGSGRSRGRDAQHTNIMAARIVAEVIGSTLGPKGMDKMLADSLGDLAIASDGRTILDRMDVQQLVRASHKNVRGVNLL